MGNPFLYLAYVIYLLLTKEEIMLSEREIYHVVKLVELELFKHSTINLESTDEKEKLTNKLFQGKTFYQVSKMYVEYLLKITNGNKEEAARLGCISKKLVYEILYPEKYPTAKFKDISYSHTKKKNGILK
jgi:hypothetical protein